MDADEAIDDQLKQHLLQLQLPADGQIVYDLSFKTFIGKHQLKFGEYAGDHHIRLFNKKHVQWNAALVHEKLILPAHFTVQKLKGHVLHYTMKDFESYSRKLFHYAGLNALKLFDAGKKAAPAKIYLSPFVSFVINYIFKLGFLDGWRGYTSARLSAFYTFLKYARLKELWQQDK